MSAVTTISLNDAQVTPVLHNFIPLGPDKLGVWWFEDQTGTAPIGYNKISLELVRPKNPAPSENSANRVSRVKIGIHTPKLEVLSNNSAGYTPAPTTAYIPRVNIEFILPERSSLQDRKDLRKYADFLLAEAQVTAMTELLQNVF